MFGIENADVAEKQPIFVKMIGCNSSSSVGPSLICTARCATLRNNKNICCAVKNYSLLLAWYIISEILQKIARSCLRVVDPQLAAQLATAQLAAHLALHLAAQLPASVCVGP